MSLFEKALGAIGGAVFGGSTRVTTNVDQNIAVGVEVNPSIGVVVEPQIANVIDTRPLADAFADAAARGDKTLAAVGQALLTQGELTRSGYQSVAAATRDGALIQGALAGQGAAAGGEALAGAISKAVSDNVPTLFFIVGAGILILAMR